MEIRIQAIHFDATVALENFIRRKVAKLEQFYEDCLEAEIVLKVVKPETVLNKEALVKIRISGNEMFASKLSDTFEESVDDAVNALQRQLIKFKEKSRAK